MAGYLPAVDILEAFDLIGFEAACFAQYFFYSSGLLIILFFRIIPEPGEFLLKR
jgi:hypothetical protein